MTKLKTDIKSMDSHLEVRHLRRKIAKSVGFGAGGGKTIITSQKRLTEKVMHHGVESIL